MPMGKLTLTPSIGVLYYDEKFNEYYYAYRVMSPVVVAYQAIPQAIVGHRMLPVR